MLMLGTHQKQRKRNHRKINAKERNRYYQKHDQNQATCSYRSKPHTACPKRRRVIRAAIGVSIVINPYLNVPPEEAQISRSPNLA